jgi:hypothetical protein
MGMTLTETGKMTNTSPQACHYTNLVLIVVVKKSAFMTLKLWTINDNRSQEIAILISMSSFTYLHHLIGV